MGWFGSGLCFDKCYFHPYNDDLAFQKVFLLVFVLLNDVRFCAFVVFVYVARDFSKASALISSEFYWGSWLGYGWVVFSWHF